MPGKRWIWVRETHTWRQRPLCGTWVFHRNTVFCTFCSTCQAEKHGPRTHVILLKSSDAICRWESRHTL